MAKIEEIHPWDIWLTDFPFEEDGSQFKSRPVIVLSVRPMWIMSVKVTKHKPRENDPYDVVINKWQEAGLKYPSTARVSKSNKLDASNFQNYLGQLHIDDRNEVMKQFSLFIKDAMEVEKNMKSLTEKE